MSGLSTSFMSDLTNGKGNPSLWIMEWIADALDKTLPELLEGIGQDSKSLEAFAPSKLRE